MTVKYITTNYTPRSYQAEIHRNLKRFNVLVLHRRAGKSILSINELIDRGLQCVLRDPQMAFVSPTYSMSKRNIWDEFKNYTKNLPGRTVNEAELRIDVPRPWLGDRVRWVLLGADNPDSLRGMYFDGCVLDEFADMHTEVWSQIIRPALSDREGFMIAISTPKGSANAFYDLFQHAQTHDNWYSKVLTVEDTKIIPETELEALREEMEDHQFEQEFMCSFQAALIGAYYGKEMELAEKENRITTVPYDKAVPVHTFFDLGIDDSTAIWFMQQVNQEYHFIDHIEESGMDLAYYVKKIKEKPYIYGEHWLPHDAAARELGTGKSRQETLRSLGLTGRIAPRQGIEDGIHASRMALGRCWFDRAKCLRGIDALKNYQRKYDSKNRIFQNKPLHDWSSHSSDAFRLFAMCYRENAARSAINSLPRIADNNYNLFGKR